MLRKKLKGTMIFGAILLVLNTIYFFSYFYMLQLPFSWLHFFYILLSTLSYVLIVAFLRFRSWQALCYISIFVFYLWAMVNFAYFKVFRAFLDFSFGQVSELNLSLLSMLKDFYFLIPARIYILTIIVCIASVVASVYYNRYSQKNIGHLFFNSRRLRVVSWNQRRSFWQILLLVIVFVIINVVALFSVSYFYKNPKILWWDFAKQTADQGLMGHFYDEVYTNLKKDVVAPPSSVDALTATKTAYRELVQANGIAESDLRLPQFSAPPNILIVQLESFDSWAINNNPSPAPFLKSLIEQNIGTTQFQGNSCETINAEYSSLCSFVPDSVEPISYSSKQNEFRCLPQILKEQYSYSTSFFHSDVPGFWSRDTLLPLWGFDNLFLTPYFAQKEDDLKVFTKAVMELSKSQKPFFGYVTTFTSHSPYNEELREYQKEKNGLTIKPFVGVIDQNLKNVEIDEDAVRDYFGFLTATDDAVRTLFEKLDKSGLLKNTVVVLYADHRFYNFNGTEQQDFYHYNNLPFVMVLPNKQKTAINHIFSQIDVAPTVLNLVAQDKYQPEAQFLGRSLFSEEQDDLAINKCLGKVYLLSSKNIFEGNAKTNQYQLRYSKNNLSELEKSRSSLLLSEFITQSDEALKNNLVH